MLTNKPSQVNYIEAYIFIYIIFILSAVYISYSLSKAPPQGTELFQGTFVVSTAAKPEDINLEKQLPITLPDMHTAKDLAIKEGWYLIPIPDEFSYSGDDKLSVYIPRLSTNIEVFINDQWLGNGGRMQESASKNTHHPLIFNMNKKQLKDKNNKLFIHIKGGLPIWTYLGEIYIGDEKDIYPTFKNQELLKVNLIIIITIGLLLTSLFTLLFWFIRREDTYYLWYSLAEMLWATHDLKLFIKEVPFSSTMWETITILAIGWSILCFVFFIHRYINQYNKKIDQLILLSGCLFTLPFLYQGIGWITFYGYKIWLVFVMTSGIYISVFLLRHFIKTKDKNTLLMIMTGLIMLIFGMHDLLAVNAIISPSSPYLLYFSAVLIILVITSLLLRRFIESLNIVEHYNEELQQQVHLKEEQLRAEYKKIQQLQEKQILNEERERIMRDIHDGIGGQLVTTLAAIESPDMTMKGVKDNLKLALQDLRMVIDSLDGDSQDITTILGALRMRLGDLLEKANIELVWKVQDLPMLEEFSPEKSLNIMRIVQEAICNVVKHSGATILTVSTFIEGDADKKNVGVKIEDNGCGMGSCVSRGRGLLNMEKRASEVGANIDISSLDGEVTQVCLVFLV